MTDSAKGELTREQVVENIARLQMHYSHPISFATQLLDSDKAMRQRLAEMEGRYVHQDLLFAEQDKVAALEQVDHRWTRKDIDELEREKAALRERVTALEQELEAERMQDGCKRHREALQAQRERAERLEQALDTMMVGTKQERDNEQPM